MDWCELREAHMAYMKWVSTIKDVARTQAEQGMLGVLAAKTQIPEGRLRTWLENKTIDQLSHGELVSLHKALCPLEDQVDVVSETEKQRAEELAKHVNKTIAQLSRPPEDQIDVVAETEKQRAEELAKHTGGGKFYTHADRIASFDESD